MPQTIPNNLLTAKEIHIRTELWKDHIYYISNNPYWNKDYQFLPLPKRFAEILTEFRNEVDKQKALERPQEERNQAQTRIKEIYQQIKELIKQFIEWEEEEEQELDLEEEWAKNQIIQQVISNIQDFFQREYNLLSDPSMATERWYTQKDLEPYLKETDYKKFKDWEKQHDNIVRIEIIEGEDGEPSHEQEIDLLEQWENLNGGEQPVKNKQELEQSLIKEQQKEQQARIKQLKLGLNRKTISQFQRFNEEQLDNNEQIKELLEEWEEEDEKSKDKQKQKQKQKQKEDQKSDEQQDEPENSREGEK